MKTITLNSILKDSCLRFKINALRYEIYKEFRGFANVTKVKFFKNYVQVTFNLGNLVRVKENEEFLYLKSVRGFKIQREIFLT